MELNISENIKEVLGYYVYQLKDPRTNEVFYIGKGKGERILSHLRSAKIDSAIDKDSEKLTIIRRILETGQKPVHEIIRHGLTEEEALLIESVLINYLGLHKLSNSVLGHDTEEFGITTLQDIINRYEAPNAFFLHPCILIKINKRYFPNISQDELYSATKESWIMGNKRHEARYALPIYKGIVKEMYQINEWYCIGKRKGFDGEIAQNEIRNLYLNHSVEHLMNKGNQNPIMYTF